MNNDFIEIHVKIIRNGGVLDSEYKQIETKLIAPPNFGMNKLFRTLIDVCNNIRLSEYLEDYVQDWL